MQRRGQIDPSPQTAPTAPLHDTVPELLSEDDDRTSRDGTDPRAYLCRLPQGIIGPRVQQRRNRRLAKAVERPIGLLQPRLDHRFERLNPEFIHLVNKVSLFAESVNCFSELRRGKA